jgi:hypothetical protein
MKQVISRISAPTPKFWKRVQRIGASLATIAFTILAIPATSGIALPLMVVNLANYALVVGITAGGVAQLAVEPEKAITMRKEYGK